jgi:hypothetical protein
LEIEENVKQNSRCGQGKKRGEINPARQRLFGLPFFA